MKQLVTILFLLSFISVVAQEKKKACNCDWEKKPDTKKLVWPLLSIREAFEDVSDKQKPAKGTITWQEGEKPTFMLNAGLALSLNRFCNKETEKESRMTFSLFAVYNRNTLIKKYQELFKTGGSMEYRFGKTREESNAYGYWNNAVQYVNNIKDTSKSVLITSYISPFRNSIKKKPGVFLNSQQHLFDRFGILLSPQAGLEYQNTFTAKAKKNEGNVLRSNVSSSVSLLIMKKDKATKPDAWPKMFEIRASYTMRNEILNTTGVKDSYIPLFKADLIYYPFFNSNVSLALTYSDGSDPVAGLPEQKFWILSLQIRK